MQLYIQNETSQLKAVILGIAHSSGKTPTELEAYDPKSLEHIKAGTYPLEADLIIQMEQLAQVLEKYEIQVFRPELIQNYNQIFARDIGFVIEDFFFKSNMISERSREITAIENFLKKIESHKVITIPQGIFIEGGDVIQYGNYIFIGTYKGVDFELVKTARTNQKGVDFFKKMFPNKKIIDLDLKKSMNNPRENILHLDCCFQPVGTHYAILYRDAFRNDTDYKHIVEIFSEENIFYISQEEMYQMNSNVLSISEKIVISDKRFTRLNQWLKSKGIEVELIDYSEVSKQGGLFRCSTLSLQRI